MLKSVQKRLYYLLNYYLTLVFLRGLMRCTVLILLNRVENPRTMRDAVCGPLLHSKTNESIFVSAGSLAPLTDASQREHCNFRVLGR